MRHFVADVRDALGAAGLVQELLLEAALFVGGLRQDCALRCVAVALPIYCIADRAARAPYTRSSPSEFDPSRLAPLILTHAASPAAYNPASVVCPSISVCTPPIM